MRKNLFPALLALCALLACGCRQYAGGAPAASAALPAHGPLLDAHTFAPYYDITDSSPSPAQTAAPRQYRVGEGQATPAPQPAPQEESLRAAGLSGAEIAKMVCGQNGALLLSRGGEVFDLSGNIRVDIQNIVDIAAGAGFGLAVQGNGTLWEWGYSGMRDANEAESGASSPEKPARIMDGVAACYAKDGAAMAIKKNGDLWLWGSYYDPAAAYDTDHELELVLTDVVSAAIGGQHMLALKGDGSVWAWGLNERGEVGVGSDARYIAAPQRVMGGVTMIAAGEDFSLALMKDGTLYGWGCNEKYALGFQSEQARFPAPVKIMEKVRLIACGDYAAMAIREDGSLWTWGDDRWGLLGIGAYPYEAPEGFSANLGPNDGEYGLSDFGDTYKKNLPHQIMEEVKLVCLGRFSAYALQGDGTFWKWGGTIVTPQPVE